MEKIKYRDTKILHKERYNKLKMCESLHINLNINTVNTKTALENFNNCYNYLILLYLINNKNNN